MSIIWGFNVSVLNNSHFYFAKNLNYAYLCRVKKEVITRFSASKIQMSLARRLGIMIILLATAYMTASAAAIRISLQEACQVAMSLDHNQISEEVYEVEGVVIGINHANHNVERVNVDLRDSLGNYLFTYHLMSYDSVVFDKTTVPNALDTILIRTRLENFKDTPSAYCGYLISVHPYADPRIELTRLTLLHDYEKQVSEQRMFYYITMLSLVIVMLAMLIGFLIYHSRTRSAEAKLYKKLASFDYLTGLYTRFRGQELITSMLSARRKGYFCIIDIDKFKNINDTYGHSIGDKVLQAMAKSFDQSRNAIYLRLGGDEFVIFEATDCDIQEYEKVATRRHEAIRSIRVDEMGDTAVSISEGIAHYDGLKSITFEELYKKADAKLYECKASGGNDFKITEV